MAKPVGFIGLGRMGGPMAANLAKAGHPVVAHDANAEARERATQVDGITVVDSAGAVAEAAGVLFTALPNNEIVREAYLGAGGIAERGGPGLITCDCSTVSPDVSDQLFAELGQKGITHFATPMLGSSPQAQSGEIFFIVGGDGSRLGEIAPYLEVMGKLHQHVGPAGQANWIKLMHNTLGAINAVAVSEILAIGLQAGISTKAFYDVVVNGGGQGYSTYFNSRVMRMAEGNFDATFTLELMNKDVNMGAEMAKQLGGPTAIIEATKRAYNEAVKNAEWAQQDLSAVTHLMEQQIGKSIVGS